MRKSTKKLMALFLAGVMVVGMTACGSKTADSNKSTTEPSAAATAAATTAATKPAEKVTLNVWNNWAQDTDANKKLYEQAVADYQKQNPNVTINTQSLSTDPYKTKMKAEFAGDASGIDVFYYWGAGGVKPFVDAGKVLPIDQYITDDIKSKIIPGTTSALEFDGKTYAIPSYGWVMSLYCNKAILEKAGAKVPTTYDELLDACKKVSKMGITPIAAGAKEPWRAGFIYQAMALREVGATDINSMLSGKTKYEGDGYKAAADKVVELYKAGAFGKNPLEADNPTSNTMLTDGKAAMSFMGSWLTPNFYDTKISKVNPDDIQAAAIPMISGGKGTDKEYCGGFVEAFFVNKATKVPEEAVKFANYINQTMGKLSYENGLAFSAYNDTFDESKVSPLFKQIKEVFSNCTANVLAWDTSLAPEAATVTNEQAQSLLTDGVDTNAFMKANADAINK